MSGINQYIIHGYPIIGHYDLPKPIEGLRPGRIILVDRGEQPSYDAYTRYVTAWQGHTDGVWDREWGNGHYKSDLNEAIDDFAARCKRGS